MNCRSDWASRYIERYHLALVEIPPGHKAPLHPGWNKPGGYITDPEAARQRWTSLPDHGIGVVLGASALCSLDVDSPENSEPLLAELGVDLRALRESCPTIQGHPSRYRIMFRVPEGLALHAHKLIWPANNGAKPITLFELRAGPVQDVLPPTIHPGTRKPYTWLTRPGDDFPPLPAVLFELWTNWDSYRRELEGECPWVQPFKPDAAPRGNGARADVIGAFNQAHTAEALLKAKGYKQRGKRWTSPTSESDLAGVALLDGRVYSHHASDPLNDGHSHDSFDVYRILDHGGDIKAAVKAAAEALGMGTTAREKTSAGAEHGPGPESTPAGDGAGKRVILERGDSIKPEPITWMWRGWLARGVMHILAGAPGCGKSTIGLAVAAIVTSGKAWPDGTPCEQGDVLIWSGEDGTNNTLLPRFLAAGGDPKRVHFIKKVIDHNGPRHFDPAIDLSALQDAARGIPNLCFVMVDPVVSAVTGDGHKNTEVRRSLQPLVDMAAELDVALLGISHFSKGTAGRDPVERVIGSVAFGALARLVMVASKIQEDDSARRVFCRGKSNIGPDDGGYEYTLVLTDVPCEPGEPSITVTRVQWGAPLEGSARDLLAKAEEATDPEKRSIREDAADWLRDLLSNGAVRTKQIEFDAKQAGFTLPTIRRAKTDLGIKAVKKGGFFDNKKQEKQEWVWRLNTEGDQLAKNAEGDQETPISRNLDHLQQNVALKRFNDAPLAEGDQPSEKGSSSGDQNTEGDQNKGEEREAHLQGDLGIVEVEI